MLNLIRNKKISPNAKKIIGILLIVLGIMGMILPILPGIWFIPFGVELLGWKLIIDRNKPWKEMVIVRKKTEDDSKD